MSDKIYVIGHKSPDLDSVAAAISYANYKNSFENTDKYVAVVPGEINKVTEFVLNKFNISKPEILNSAEGKDIVLVDHNEFVQAVAEIEKANIVEILDHHKLNFSYPNPIAVMIKPWGSSNSLIYHLYKGHRVEMNKNLAGLMLSAVLDDTVITKSPTTTEIDKEIIKELSEKAEIKDWQEYGIEMFKVKSSVKDFTALEVIKSDFKDYEFKAGKFGYGQIETVDLNEFKNREEELIKELEKMQLEGGYEGVILIITDILKEGSQVLAVAKDMERIEKTMHTKFENNTSFVKGLISRKKQVIPPFAEEFDK